MKRIGFIGMGNMGYAILKGLLQVFDREVLLLTDADRKRAEKISEETGVACAADNAACASMADYVVLAVKPQYYDAVLSDIKDTVTKEKIIISIAPSVTIQDLKEKLGQDQRIVRAMPNTPALVGMGVTGVCYEAERFSAEERVPSVSFLSPSFHGTGGGTADERSCLCERKLSCLCLYVY